MTLQTLVLVILWFFAFLFLSGLLIAIFFIGRGTVKNNPKKALILLKVGDDIQAFKGKLTDTSKKGFCYSYGNNKKVIVPSTYQQVFNRNKRLLFINKLGQLISSPFGNDTALSDTEKEDLIYELVSSHIGADGMRALKGKEMPATIIIAIIAFILGVCAVFGYNYFNQSITMQRAITPPTNHNTIITP